MRVGGTMLGCWDIMGFVPGVWAVLLSSELEGTTRTPVCFHASVGGGWSCSSCV